MGGEASGYRLANHPSYMALSSWSASTTPSLDILCVSNKQKSSSNIKLLWAETMICFELSCIKTEFGASDMWNKACVLCQEGNIFRTQEITRNACRELSLRSMWHSLCTVSSMSPSCVYIPSTSSTPLICPSLITLLIVVGDSDGPRLNRARGYTSHRELRSHFICLISIFRILIFVVLNI